MLCRGRRRLCLGRHQPGRDDLEAGPGRGDDHEHEAPGGDPESCLCGGRALGGGRRCRSRRQDRSRHVCPAYLPAGPPRLVGGRARRARCRRGTAELPGHHLRPRGPSRPHRGEGQRAHVERRFTRSHPVLPLGRAAAAVPLRDVCAALQLCRCRGRAGSNGRARGGGRLAADLGQRPHLHHSHPRRVPILASVERAGDGQIVPAGVRAGAVTQARLVRPGAVARSPAPPPTTPGRRAGSSASPRPGTRS